MKALVAVLVGLLFAHSSVGAEANLERMYYVGEAKLSSDTGQPRGSQVILLQKTHDPANHRIVERAVVAKRDGGVDDYTMNMTVDGDSFTIRDAQNTIEGSGKLFGPAWHWTYFKASYKSSNGAVIEDENFMTDPDVLVGRKKISAPNGKVVMYMDVTLKAVTPETFEILVAALLKEKKK